MQKINKVEIKPYSDKYVSLHEEFSKKFWPDKRRRRIESYNRWKFRGPRKGTVDGLLIALYENKIVGQMGLIPVELKNGNDTYNAQWICDWMVDSEYRSLGIGSKLTETAMMRDNMITLGNNPSVKAEKVMEKIGFKHLKCGRIMIFPLNPEPVLKWVIPGKMSGMTSLFGKMIKPYFSLKVNKYKKLESDYETCRWENISELINERQNKLKYPQVLHDKKFLEWRANGLENFSERIAALKSHKGGYALYSPFAQYLDVYDWYCPDFGELEKMFTSLVNLALKNNSTMIQLVANDEQEESLLKKLGFIRTRSTETVLQFSKDKFIDKEDRFYFALFDTDRNL
ncbi:MAG: GNAT family N-acetyltransferase [Ignavibacteria bacterium]